MKRKFSTSWKASKQPRKQRKYLANAPLHLKKKFLTMNLSKELRVKQKKRNMVARKGDVVKIMRGKFKKKQGKILEVYLKLSKVTIEGIQVKKTDGSKVAVKMRPSNLQIIELAERGKVTKRPEIKSQALSKQSDDSSTRETKKTTEESKGTELKTIKSKKKTKETKK